MTMTLTAACRPGDALFKRLRLMALILLAVVFVVPSSWVSAVALILVGAVLAAVLASADQRRLLMQPWLQLGLLGMVFFGVLPEALASWVLSWDPQYRDYATQWESHWSRVLLVGVLAGLLVAALFRPWPKRSDQGGGDPWVAGFGMVLALTAAGVQLLRIDVPFAALLPVMVAFGLMLAAFLVPLTKRWSALILLGSITVLTLGALVKADLGKQPVFTLVVLAGVVVVRWRIRLLAVLAGGALLSMLAVVMLALTLPPHPVQGSGLTRLGHEIATAVHYKVWVRQMQTVACFTAVVDQHWDTPASQGPFYFAQALVPRALWPEKPRVPDGAGYSRQYCNIPYAMPDHSSSVTLLGEPLIMAGPWGLAAAVAVLVLILDRVGMLMLRGGVWAAWSAALAPWLIDFDQHYAMYVANVAKSGLALAPLAVGLAWWVQSRRRRQSNPLAPALGTRK